MRPVPKLALLIILVLLLVGAAPPVKQSYGVLASEALETYEAVLHKLNIKVQLHDGFVVGKLQDRMKGTATAFIRGRFSDKPQIWWIFRIKVKKFRVITVTRFPGIPPSKWWI